MESSLKDEIEARGSLLNHAKAEPLSVMRTTPSDSCRCRDGLRGLSFRRKL